MYFEHELRVRIYVNIPALKKKNEGYQERTLTKNAIKFRAFVRIKTSTLSPSLSLLKVVRSVVPRFLRDLPRCTILIYSALNLRKKIGVHFMKVLRALVTDLKKIIVSFLHANEIYLCKKERYKVLSFILHFSSLSSAFFYPSLFMPQTLTNLTRALANSYFERFT